MVQCSDVGHHVRYVRDETHPSTTGHEQEIPYLLLSNCLAGTADLGGPCTALLLLQPLKLLGIGCCAHKLFPAAANTFIIAPGLPGATAVVATRAQVVLRSPSAAGRAGSSCI